MPSMTERTWSARLDDARRRYSHFRGQTHATPALLVIIFAFLAILPIALDFWIIGLTLGSYISTRLLVLTLIWATTAQAWNMLSGFSGQFSFGHAAFFGLGAYVTIILAREFAINPWIGIFVASAVAGLYGLFIGVLLFRFDLKGHYFALATLAFAELLRATFRTVDFLGGASGFFRPLPGTYADDYGLIAFQFQSQLPYYYVILAFLLIVTLVSLAIRESRLGMYLFAIRENENSALAVGIPTFRYKLVAYGTSSFFTAWGGAFWAFYFVTIQPDTVFDIIVNVEILLPAIVGGLGTVIGPILGALFVFPAADIFRQVVDVPGMGNVFYGIVLIIIVLYSPKGLVSWPGKFFELLARYGPYESAITTDEDDDDQ